MWALAAILVVKHVYIAEKNMSTKLHPSNLNKIRQPVQPSSQHSKLVSGGDDYFTVVQRVISNPRLLSPSDISVLQRTIGNQAAGQVVGTLLQRQEHQENNSDRRSRSVPVSSQLPNLNKWRSLINFTPPDSVESILSQRNTGLSPIPYTNWSVQKIEDGFGKINLDYYPVAVTKLPNMNGRRMSAESMLQYIRTNINEFVDENSAHFEGYDEGEIKKWQSPSALGSIIHIDMGGNTTNPFQNPDDGSVIVSDFSPDSWTFTTIQTPHDFQHPVSGNRKFGFDQQNDGSYVFYTRGADRATGLMDWALSGGINVIFEEAHKLWLSFQHKIASFVNENGGSARIQAPTSRRYDWEIVKKYYWNPSKYKHSSNQNIESFRGRGGSFGGGGASGSW